MGARSFSFQVGDIECAVLLDGARLIGAEGVMGRFPEVSEAECRRAYEEIGLSLDEAADSFNILLARIGGETVLVDAGQAGRPYGGLLPESLRLAGVAPESVTLVIITHCHGDHVQGLLTPENEPLFPNASYVMSKEEFAFWQSRLGSGPVDHRPIVAMVQKRGLRLIEMDEQILPGLTAVPLPGHTPGQIGVLLESGKERLIHLADLLHLPMQFAHPEWSPRFDFDTGLSVPIRRAALRRAADDKMLALFYHLPFPGLGRVGRGERGFTWEVARADH